MGGRGGFNWHEVCKMLRANCNSGINYSSGGADFQSPTKAKLAHGLCFQITTSMSCLCFTYVRFANNTDAVWTKLKCKSRAMMRSMSLFWHISELQWFSLQVDSKPCMYNFTSPRLLLCFWRPRDIRASFAKPAWRLQGLNCPCKWRIIQAASADWDLQDIHGIALARY